MRGQESTLLLLDSVSCFHLCSFSTSCKTTETEEQTQNAQSEAEAEGFHVNSLQSSYAEMVSTRNRVQDGAANSLGRRVLDELDTLADVTTKALVALGQELLLVVVGGGNDVDGLLGTLGAELDGDGEEVTASLLLDSVTAVDAGKVDECRLANGRLALDGLEHVLGEAEASVGHGEGCRTGTVLGLDDLITTELDTCENKESVLLGAQEKKNPQ